MKHSIAKIALAPPPKAPFSVPSHWKNGCIFSYTEDYVSDNYKTKEGSQCGQDIVVEILCPSHSNRLFLDIGANDGVNGSSTYQLEINGWRGLLVEPNINLIPSILSYRKNSDLIACAIGKDKGILNLHTSDVCHTLGTLIDDSTSFQVKKLLADSGGSKNTKKLKVPVMPISDLISSFTDTYNSNPDFLKIDVEGLEAIILDELFKTPCRPPIIETENFLRDETSAEILLKQGYTLQIVMDTFVEIWTSPLILNQGKLPEILVTKLNKKHLISYKRQVADR